MSEKSEQRHESNRDKDGRQYLLDSGHKFSRNRLAIWIDSELRPGFTVYDNNRTKRELRASEPLSTDRLQMVSVDFATSPDFHSLSLSVDGRTIQWSMAGEGIEIDKRLLERRLHLGADLKRQNGAAFDISSLIAFDRVLSVETQLEIYQAFWPTLNPEAEGGLRFSHKAMFQQEKNSQYGLVAPADDYRPTLLGGGGGRQMSNFFMESDVSKRES